MTTRLAPLPALLIGTALALSACHQAKKPAVNTIDAMDNALVESTPTAETNGLAASDIKVDPARAKAGGRAHGTDAETVSAGETSEDAGDGPCLARNRDHLSYGNGWAGKLPADLPLHPQARLTEAAGHSGDCEVRAVSFTVNDEPEAVLAWYEDQTRAKGWDAGRTTRDGEVWLAGTKGDAAFTVMTHGTGHGTSVDYIWTSGN